VKRPAKDVKIDGRGKIDLPKRKKGHCRWCKKKIKAKRRRTWCSPECLDAYFARDGRAVKAAVRQRDKGICSFCKIDTFAQRRGLPKENPMRDEYLALHGIPKSRIRTRWFDIDHIKPVSEGGKMVLANLRTLCLKCHHTRTKEWNAKKRIMED
jgi:hypothetical protein